MQLGYVRDLATTAAGEKVSDVVITVPPYFSQSERDAVADAVEIAGMRLLALVNDGSAVAVNYAMTRTFPEQERHVIFDAGASSIRATVATFSANGTGTSISVEGVGYARDIAGTELDRRLRDLLVADFTEKHPSVGDVTKDKRGMAKLWKEAGRLKGVLSANTEASSTVESLAFDVDFRTKTTRARFEEACQDLVELYSKPITDALKMAGVTLVSP
jgi:hypoxia up-regulated 1